MKDEALKLALEALGKARSRIVEAGGSGWKLEAQRCVNALTTIKQALAAPVQKKLNGWWAHTNPETGLVDVVNYQLTQADKAHGWIEQEIYTTSPAAQPAPVQKRTNYAVHLHHCNIGECEGVCKYGDDDCPALEHADMKAKWDRSTTPAAQRPWFGLTEKEILECRSANHLHFYLAIQAKLKGKNT
jgi:hypothetical protein